jgi:hypothetical protein
MTRLNGRPQTELADDEPKMALHASMVRAWLAFIATGLFYFAL